MTEITRQPLLVGIGATDDHHAALGYATMRATHEQRPLQLIHVIREAHDFAGPENLLIDFDGAHLAASALVQGAAERVNRLTQGAVPVTTATPQGAVVTVLTKLASDAAGVILEHRRRGHLATAIHRSITAAVASRSSAPVTSVPQDWKPGQLGTGHGRVTVVLEDQDSANYLMAHAVEAAASRDALLTVVPTWIAGANMPSRAHPAGVRSPGHRNGGNEVDVDDAERLVAPWRVKCAELDIDVCVPSGSGAVAALCAPGWSDLLMLGRSQGRLHGRGHSSLARQLLQDAPGPVEVLPLPDITT